MRLDHIAYRSKDRYKTAKFFEDCFGYTIGTEFQVEFDDETKADCLALVPPEERHPDVIEWRVMLADAPKPQDGVPMKDPVYHAYDAPPEIFVSDGVEGSIVGDWVKERGNIGGIHHIAYEVDNVAATMQDWKDKGYAEFYSEEPLECPGLIQVFTKPSELTGVIYELINRSGKGFCEDNVKGLMESTKGE